MRKFRGLLNQKTAPAPTVIDVATKGQRLLTEYVLNMAVSALAHVDITPLYELYMDDARLSDEDREELGRAYFLLQMTSPTPAEVA